MFKFLCQKTKKGEKKPPDEGLLMYTFKIHPSLFQEKKSNIKKKISHKMIYILFSDPL